MTEIESTDIKEMINPSNTKDIDSKNIDSKDKDIESGFEIMNPAKLSRHNSQMNIVDEEEEYHPENSSLFEILKLYFDIIFKSFMVSIVPVIFCVVVSFLPFTNDIDNYKNYFSVPAITALLCLAMVSFGPFYITYYAYMISGILPIKYPLRYILHVFFHICFWPIFFSILVYYQIFVWYYYVDFTFFALCFLPLSVHAAYDIIYNGNLYNTIKFAIAEFCVTVSALMYTFILFPIFLESSNVIKIIWRLTLHPIWFEMTILLPERVMTIGNLSIANNNDKFYSSFIPVMHSIFHNITLGRMLLYSVNDIYMCLLLTMLTNLIEIILRLSILKRDDFFKKFIGLSIFKKCFDTKSEEQSGEQREKNHQDELDRHGAIIIMELLLEIVSIFISPIIMICFMKYKYMFNFNGGSTETSLTIIFINFALQFIFEIPTDLLCMIFEIRNHKIELYQIWNKIGNKKTFIFAIYGMCTMGILGMLYLSLRLPRLIFCSSQDILDCTYSPI